jgi:hydroxymethylbilane synthase|tara:strand:- start:1761 stop:2681 length:921 start_codon:yes stop_codon:yes gene_type:complete
VKKIKIATRRSPLAIWQAEYVKKELIRNHSDIEIQIVRIQTEGDRFLDAPLFDIGGKGLFIKELEEALLSKNADIAVHSMKDVIVELPKGLEISVIMKREDSRDVLISNQYNSIAEIPDNSTVGTSSLRRQSQLKQVNSNILFEDLRGNVETRIGKLDDGKYDAIILAAAGIIRLGLAERITEFISFSHVLPAVGQGAIGIECRTNDETTQQLIAPLNDKDTSLCVLTERAFSRRLNGGCQLPIASHAVIENNQIKVDGLVARLDGSKVIRLQKIGELEDADKIGSSLAEALLDNGADAILKDYLK